MDSFRHLDNKDFQRYDGQNVYFNKSIRKTYQNYSIDKEVMFSDILNAFLTSTSITARRVDNKKSHHDIEVSSDYHITKIDIEAPHHFEKVFSNYPKYSDYWKYHRYLARKVDALQPDNTKWFGNDDIYIQYNTNDLTQFWWTTFGIIRTKCTLNELVSRDKDPRMRESYYQAPKETPGIIQHDIDSLIEFIIKNHKII